MADRYTGIIEILKSDIEKTPKLKDVVQALFYNRHGELYDDDMWDDDSPIAIFKDIDARYGRFEELEELLMELKVPFDRWSDAYCGDDAEQVYYRPELNETKVFYTNGRGEFIVTVSELSILQNGLDLESTEGLLELGKRLKAKLDAIPNIPSLTSYEKNRGIYDEKI